MQHVAISVNALGGEYTHDATLKKGIEQASENHRIRNIRHLELVQA